LKPPGDVRVLIKVKLPENTEARGVMKPLEKMRESPLGYETHPFLAAFPYICRSHYGGVRKLGGGP